MTESTKSVVTVNFQSVTVNSESVAVQFPKPYYCY